MKNILPFFILINLFTFYSLNLDAQTTLTYSGGSWSPYAPSSSTGSDNVIIDDTDVNFTNGSQMNNLTINAGRSIRLYSRHITVNGDLTIEAQGSLAIQGSGSVTVVGTTTMSTTGSSSTTNFNVWSSPFQGSVDILTTFPGVNPCDVYAFQATDQTFRYDYSMPFSTTCNGNSVTFTSTNALVDGVADGNFDVGRGYFVPGNSTSTRSFVSTSALNNGTINVPIYGSSVSVAGGNDWNLIGNPYPSTVRVGTFLTTNSSLINAVYLYNGATGGFITKGVGSSFGIAANQGFYIESTTSTDGFLGNIVFENAHRRNNNTSFYKSDAASSNVMTSYFSLENNGISDQIKIIFDADCQDTYDKKYDARKLMNPNNLNFASLIEMDQTQLMEPFVFNGLQSPEPNSDKSVNLYVETPSSGLFTIQLDSVSNMDANIGILLIDNVLNTTTNLRAQSYQFQSNSADTLDNRFSLNFTNTNTSVNESFVTNDISITSFEGRITAFSKTNAVIKNLQIIDLSGRIISDYAQNSTNILTVPTNHLQQGVYIVKVTDSNGQQSSEKLFIH